MKGRQHEAIRVPQGWTGQDKALIIQLENIFNELYRICDRLGVDIDDLGAAKADKVASATDGHFASLDENGNLEDSGHEHDDYVTEVSFDATTNKISRIKAGTSSDIATVATLDGNGKVPSSQLPSYVDDVEEYADRAHFPTTGEADKIYVARDTGFTYRWSGTQYVRLNAYDEATQNASGLMSAADKTKLDGVETGANRYELPLAASGTRGGVQTGYTTDGANRNYAVQLDSEKMYVNVPWTDTHQDISGKADKVSGGTENNFAALDSSGNLKDSGHKHSDYLTSHQDISGKADKVSSATSNNFAALDANGNLKDSGHKHNDYLTEHQDISGKADKATTVTAVTYDSTNKKITKTINGSTTDVVSVSTIKSALGAFTWGQIANLS